MVLAASNSVSLVLDMVVAKAAVEVLPKASQLVAEEEAVLVLAAMADRSKNGTTYSAGNGKTFLHSGGNNSGVILLFW